MLIANWDALGKALKQGGLNSPLPAPQCRRWAIGRHTQPSRSTRGDRAWKATRPCCGCQKRFRGLWTFVQVFEAQPLLYRAHVQPNLSCPHSFLPDKVWSSSSTTFIRVSFLP